MVLSGLVDGAISRRPKSPSSLLYPLGLLHLRLVGRLRLLQTRGRVGERPVLLLVVLGLLPCDLAVLPGDFRLTNGAFLLQLLAGAVVLFGLLLRGPGFFGQPLVINSL